MGTGYIRNDTANNIADGNVINASDLDGEFDAVQAAFNASTGHSHDGTTGEGPQIQTAALADDAVTGDKIDSTTTVTAASFVGPLTGNVSGNVTGNASTATALQTARTIAGQSFDGTANISIAPTDLTGVTASAAELNIMDGVTATTAEINKLDGVTATTAELNYTDGVTSNIQTQLDAMVEKAGDSMTGDLSFGDNNKAIFGAGNDLQIYHDGSGSRIYENGTGVLAFYSNGSGINFYKGEAAGNMLTLSTDGAVTAYYNNLQKLATTSTGIDVTGEITTDGLTTSADINFGDNDKAVFGDGDDLQIYHNGTNSYVDDTGTGWLYLRADERVIVSSQSSGNVSAKFFTNAQAELAYNNNTKLATTSTGIDVTGTAEMDTLSIGGTAVTATAAEINYVDGVTSNVQTQLDAKASTGKAIAMAIVFG